MYCWANASSPPHLHPRRWQQYRAHYTGQAARYPPLQYHQQASVCRRRVACRPTRHALCAASRCREHCWTHTSAGAPVRMLAQQQQRSSHQWRRGLLMQHPRPYNHSNHLMRTMVTRKQPKGGQLLVPAHQKQLHTQQQVANHGRRALMAGRCWQPVALGQQVEQPASATVESAAARQMPAVRCRQNSRQGRHLSGLMLRRAHRHPACDRSPHLGT